MIEVDDYNPLERLEIARTQWSNEIPDMIIHSSCPNNKYKIRTGWFTGVAADVFYALDEGWVKSEHGIKAAKQLIRQYISYKWNEQDLKTSNDIQTVNQFIDEILKHR